MSWPSPGSPGCSVGAGLSPTCAALPPRYTEAPQPGQTGSAAARGGEVQHFVAGADVPPLWWAAFRSPALDALVARALAHNPSLEAAQQTLHQAQETTLAQKGAFLPQASAQLNRTRQELSGAESGVPGFTQTFSVYDAQLNVSYTFDVWGLNRRTVQADIAREQSQRFQLEGAETMLAANTASTVITAASLAAQIAAEQQLIGAEEQVLRTVRSQFQLGAATGADVATQEAQLANTQALVVPLQTQLAQARHQLAAYVGEVPAEASLPTIALADLTLPASLPLSVPARLVEQRPDIRASEAQLQVAVADIGIAIANRLPQLTLSGFIGTRPAKLEQLFQPGNGTFSLLSQILGPVFQGGTLLHQQRGAVGRGARGGGELPQHGGDRLPERGRRADGAHAGRKSAGGESGGGACCGAQPQPGAASVWRGRRGVPLGSDVADAIPERGDRPDTGAGRTVLGHGRAFRGTWGGWWNRSDVAPPPQGFWRSLAP